MIRIIKYPKTEDWADLMKRPTLSIDHLDSVVKNILTRVKNSGDLALKEFSEKFDKAKIDSFLTSEKEISEAKGLVPQELKDAIDQAYNNIFKFHEAQQKDELKVETMSGVTCWRKSLPIEKVGLYIPGGSAPLFSSVLMLGTPAKIANCEEVIICTPPQSDGKINPAILYAANKVGITKIFKVGGAQAVGAMAYGTETISKVDKIFGPGNQYVTAAKQQVSLEGTAIDMPAGPSEVMVLTDENSEPRFVASDLLSQAEHGKDSQVVLISTDGNLLERVNEEVETQLEQLPRKEIAQECLKNSLSILVKDQHELMAMSNFYAPEHLIIATTNADDLALKVTNAGSVFIGDYTPESAGDYASGTNHTLPTNGAARAYSGVSLDSFMKQVTFQKISAEGLKKLGGSIEILAQAEELMAHSNAVTVRLNKLKNGN